MSTKTYKHETQIFNPDTGEIFHDTKYSVTAVNNEEDYIKVYRYLNTVFAFKGIERKLIPTLMEICNYMTFADKGQEVVLIKPVKEKMSGALGIGIKEIEKHIKLLKKADVLRTITNPVNNKPYRSTFAVNPFIVGRGKWSDIKELRAQFDYDSGLITAQSIVVDKITGETIAKVTQEVKKNQKQIPGQMTLFDGQDKITTEAERYTLYQIQQLFDYNALVQEGPSQMRDIDSVMDILHTVMNDNKPTIRINGEDKPTMAVIRKLMKLDKKSIMYAIGKFSEQTGRIKDPVAYMLTLLYHATGQDYFDDKNKASHDNAAGKTNIGKGLHRKQSPTDTYRSFPQRTYNYDELEKELLGRNRDSS